MAYISNQAHEPYNATCIFAVSVPFFPYYQCVTVFEEPCYFERDRRTSLKEICVKTIDKNRQNQNIAFIDFI